MFVCCWRAKILFFLFCAEVFSPYHGVTNKQMKKVRIRQATGRLACQIPFQTVSTLSILQTCGIWSMIWGGLAPLTPPLADPDRTSELPGQLWDSPWSIFVPILKPPRAVWKNLYFLTSAINAPEGSNSAFWEGPACDFAPFVGELGCILSSFWQHFSWNAKTMKSMTVTHMETILPFQKHVFLV